MPNAQPLSSPTWLAGVLRRWQLLSGPARLYLLHAALLTSSLAIYGLFFNLAIEALGFSREFLGVLNGMSIATAAVLSIPLWWLVTRIGLKQSLALSAVLQAISAAMIAWAPTSALLLLAVAFTGMAATMFQVSAPPFMMQHSSAATRDQLFSANTAINVGLAGIATFFAGQLKAWLAGMLGTAPESALAYRATFMAAGIGLLVSILPLLLIRSRQRAAPASAATLAIVPTPAKPAATRASAQPPAADFWLARLPGMCWLLPHLPEPIPSFIRQPALVVPLLVSPLLISFGAALLIQYLNLFFKDQFAINDIVLGQIFAAIGVATGLAALAAPLVSARLGKPWTIVLTQLLSIPFLLLMGFVPLLSVAIGAALARGALFNMGSPLYDAFAMERTNEAARPIVIGLINGAYTVGYLIAPLVSTRVQGRFGFAPLFVATALFYGAAAAANYWLFIRNRTDRAAQATLPSKPAA